MVIRAVRLLPLLLGASLAGALAAQHAAAAGKDFDEKATPTQLPRGVRPIHYDVSLEPDAAKRTFMGRTVVTLAIERPSATITLNALDVRFARVELQPDGAAPLPAPRVAIDEAHQTATFTFARPLAAGSYRLSMDYTGTIETEPFGLF